MIEIVAIDTPSLGNRGYLATDGTVAMVVDAQRDFDRVLAIANELSVTITHVLETHMHNDYVTGGFALAAAVGAHYLVNAADPVSFRRTIFPTATWSPSAICRYGCSPHRATPSRTCPTCSPTAIRLLRPSLAARC